MDAQPPPRFLSIVVRSEPGGIEIDWDTDLTGDDLRAACRQVDRVVDRRFAPMSGVAERPLPEQHPHRDELFIPSRSKPGEMRFIAVVVGEGVAVEWPVEPSAHERSLGAAVTTGPIRRAGNPFVVRNYSCGTNRNDVQARGPLVAYDELVGALRTEFRRRGL